MTESIRIGFEWNQYYDENKTNEDLFAQILECENLAAQKQMVIANWQSYYEGEGCQPVIDWLVENSQKLSHLESLRIGDIEQEEAELSWIVQGDYSRLWAAFPQLKHLIIQGSQSLQLGNIRSEALESIEIICGGLPQIVIHSIAKAQTPNLAKLNLYLGVDEYGFDACADDIKTLLEESSFPKLRYLGLCNTAIAEEVTELILASKYAAQIEIMDISKSVFTDKAAQMILDGVAKLGQLKRLDLNYHFVSAEFQQKLKELPFEVDLKDPQEYNQAKSYYNSPMFTE